MPITNTILRDPKPVDQPLAEFTIEDSYKYDLTFKRDDDSTESMWAARAALTWTIRLTLMISKPSLRTSSFS